LLLLGLLPTLRLGAAQASLEICEEATGMARMMIEDNAGILILPRFPVPSTETDGYTKRRDRMKIPPVALYSMQRCLQCDSIGLSTTSKRVVAT